MSTPNFNNKYFDYVYNQGDDTVSVNFPMIFFIHSGELMVECGDERITINKGESVFLRHGSTISFQKKNCGEEPFCGIYIGFSETILSELYHNTIRYKKEYQSGCINSYIIRLPCLPCIQSLYVSMATYLEWGIKPSEYIVELKQQEGIFSLLLVDEKFYNSLFDSLDKKQSFHYLLNINNLKN